MIRPLLVLPFLVQLVEAASTNTTSECPAPDATSCNSRSVWSILGTCALTLFICTWKAAYPNMFPEKRWYTVALYRMALGLSALLAPEITTMRAYSEWKEAGKIQEEFCSLRWTRTHGFFLLMGGFVLQDGVQRQVLNGYSRSREQLKNAATVIPKITKKEIMDKSKSDGLGNALLVLQLSWFILQVVARAMNGLAITLLEIDTLALAALSLPLFFFWWSKPLAPECPHIFYTHVPQTSSNSPDEQEPFEDEDILVSRRVIWEDEIFGPGIDKELDASALLAVWIILGALHLIAWDFQFSSQVEKIIWRVASLTLIATPCFLFLAEWFGLTDSGRGYFLDFDDMDITRFILLSIGVVARLVLMVLMFANLRDLPATAYETVSWTVYIPHL
ncbi:hypothetical protein BDN67DRAFT_84427 [Paxillus ammoniavirescens]|nr:hypothetical protein BDN67DRAFT_84427 [Paxillus ammoniavirescens]